MVKVNENNLGLSRPPSFLIIDTAGAALFATFRAFPAMRIRCQKDFFKK